MSREYAQRSDVQAFINSGLQARDKGRANIWGIDGSTMLVKWRYHHTPGVQLGQLVAKYGRVFFTGYPVPPVDMDDGAPAAWELDKDNGELLNTSLTPATNFNGWCCDVIETATLTSSGFDGAFLIGVQNSGAVATAPTIDPWHPGNQCGYILLENDGFRTQSAPGPREPTHTKRDSVDFSTQGAASVKAIANANDTLGFDSASGAIGFLDMGAYASSLSGVFANVFYRWSTGLSSPDPVFVRGYYWAGAPSLPISYEGIHGLAVDGATIYAGGPPALKSGFSQKYNLRRLTHPQTTSSQNVELDEDWKILVNEEYAELNDAITSITCATLADSNVIVTTTNTAGSSIPHIHAFAKSDGSLSWRYTTGGFMYGCHFDGTYIWACGEKVNGKNIWKFDTDGELVGSWGVGRTLRSIMEMDGDIYILGDEV